MKEVKKTSGSKNFYLSIYRLIKGDIIPNHIAKILNISKQDVYYYTSKLKKAGYIRRNPDTNVWEVLKEFDENEVKKVKKTTSVASNQLVSDSVRGHAFTFVIKLPSNFNHWLKREGLFVRLGVKFDVLNLGGVSRGQRIKFNGRKIHVFDNSIVIYDKSSYYADTSIESRKKAFYSILELVRALERLLRAKFSISGKYKIRVARQHYSLIKNALAGEFYRDGKKLEVYTEKGLWLLIDNSLNLHELETVHPKTSADDNKKVQDFFNDLKKHDGYTPAFVTNTMQGIQENQLLFAKNINTHIKAIQDLGIGVNRLTKLIEELKQEGVRK